MSPNVKWTRLACGHTVLWDAAFTPEPDGCERCRAYEMKDYRDRHPWQGRRPAWQRR